MNASAAKRSRSLEIWTRRRLRHEKASFPEGIGLTPQPSLSNVGLFVYLISPVRVSLIPDQRATADRYGVSRPFRATTARSLRSAKRVITILKW